MRVAVDVSPLSHQRSGVGAYLLSLLYGLVENGAEVVAFAPVSVRVKRQVEEALGDLDVERRLPVLPLAHRWRTAWSRAQRPAAERWLGRFDVLHFSDWMYPPQRGGVRATTIHDLVPLRYPEWTHGRTVHMHGAKYRHAAQHAHLLSASRTTPRGTCTSDSASSQRVLPSSIRLPLATTARKASAPTSADRTC